MLTDLELRVLNGEPFSSLGLSESQLERLRGFEAWARGDDLGAVQHFRRSAALLEPQSRDWAISERLHGLALIRVQREVEGTFSLDRADAVLEAFGIEPFQKGF
jgi:hypothetical protein